MSSRLVVGVLLVVATAIAAEWAFWHVGASAATVLTDLVAGWAFVAAGIVARWRQPASRIGPLMIAEGSNSGASTTPSTE